MRLYAELTGGTDGQCSIAYLCSAWNAKRTLAEPLRKLPGAHRIPLCPPFAPVGIGSLQVQKNLRLAGDFHVSVTVLPSHGTQ